MYKIVICLFILCSGIVRGFAADLPVLYITTPDGSAITSKEEWREGCRLRIVLPDGTTAYDSDKAALKGRGHSTFTKPKKPFAIKLDEKSGLLGMEKGKRWVLLANFMDHSLLRNKLAFSIARQTSLAWTPDSRFVDVVVNGKPQGFYLLCEQIRVNENRVNIDEKEGYLLEADAYLDEKNHFYTPRRHLPVNMKEPGDAQQLPYIQRYFQEIEDLLYGRGNDLTKLYEKYIDLESFVDWWLVHELTQNAEPNGPRSCYMYKDKDSLLKAGPVWDFDLAFIEVGLDKDGNIRPARLHLPEVPLLTVDSLYNRKALWYDRLLEDPVFRRQVQVRWQELEPRFRAIAGEIDRWAEEIEASALADERLWQGQDPARFDTHTTFHASVKNLKQTYLKRIDVLKQKFIGTDSSALPMELNEKASAPTLPIFTLKGQVTDIHGKPIRRAYVTHVGKTEGIATDSNGYFSIQVYAYEQLSFIHTGHVEQRIVVQPSDSFINIRMYPEAPHLSGFSVQAISKAKKVNSKDVSEYYFEDNLPVFKGYLDEFIKKRLRYPRTAIRAGIEGEVIATFLIDTKGNVTDLCIVQSVSEELDKETLRVLSLMPRWKPARHSAKPIPFRFTISINFQLQSPISQ